MVDKTIKERRKHPRFQVKDGAVAVLKSSEHCKVGTIIDVSEGGLAFKYFDEPELFDGPLTVDIMIPQEDFTLLDIPCTPVADFKIPSETAFSMLPMMRCGLQFHQLNDHQANSLQLFLDQHTTR
jgi:hypothetical protein